MSDETPTAPPTKVGPKIEVTSVAGQKIELLHQSEKDLYEEAKAKYLSEYTFTHANDKRTLDRLLNLEVQCHRYQWYTLAGLDYDRNLLTPREESEYRKAIKEIQAQIADCQKDLGVTKAEREKSMNAESVGGYITDLLQRAKEFGVNREKMADRSIELTKELFATVGAYLRSNENERRKLGLEDPETIIQWIWEVMKPEFDEIDEHFRQNSQRYWVRRL